jgi:hypothetical protein
MGSIVVRKPAQAWAQNGISGASGTLMCTPAGRVSDTRAFTCGRPLSGCRITLVLLLGLIVPGKLYAQFGDVSPETDDRFGHTVARGDFNNDGYQDLAIGLPYEGIRTGVSGRSSHIPNAGAVEVIYGSATGLNSTGRQFWRQGSNGVNDTPESGDQFGYSLAAGDFNGDDFSDLAIGVPFESVWLITGAGAVNVLYGSPQGLTASGVAPQLWHQESLGVSDRSEPSDFFGESLAAGDFNRDGYVDLAIGVPYEDLEPIVDAGAVHILYGSPSGLTTAFPDDQFWTQDTAGVDDTSEPGDNFGKDLTTGDFNGDTFADLAIGAPWETIGGNTEAGAVNVIYGSAAGLSATIVTDQFLYQTQVIPDGAEFYDEFGWVVAAGDFNGDGFDDLAVAVSGEDVGAILNAGAVNVLYGSPNRLVWTGVAPQFWHQDSGGIEDVAERGDEFGSSLAVGDFNDDGCDDLAVGVVNETIGGLLAAGAVNVIYGSPTSGLSAYVLPDQLWHQGSTAMTTTLEASDWFGYSLAAGDFNGDGYADLAVGVPGQDVNGVSNAGAVNIIHGSTSKLNATFVPMQAWAQQYVLPPQP